MGRLRRILRRGRPRTPNSRRGLLLLFVLVAGTGAALTVGAGMVIAWTDSPSFCGSCHTMEPELKGYEISAHRTVDCIECHTDPGLNGWIKAKINGTRQLLEVATGTFPTPIPPPDHSQLPSVEVTCRRCHNVEPLVADGGPIKLVLHDQYALDPPSTRQTVALVVRPNGFGSPEQNSVGVHWHIESDVEYRAADPRAQKIDYVSVNKPDGTFEEFIAYDQISDPGNVLPDVARLANDSPQRRMDCISCHNRVGHEVPTIGNAIDQRITAGEISTKLPDIKRLSVEWLSTDYASEDEADAVIDRLHDYYATKYPLIAESQSEAIDSAVASLKTAYRLLATPEMKASPYTYPNNIGHQDAPGCFRCHDGAHYKVVSGKATSETIPSQCSTCHTFPQIGQYESGVLIGERPSSHDGRLWVFDHKLNVTSDDPTDQSCATCHTRTYCDNCHATTAVNVAHDEMVTNHAQAIRDNGAASCAYCHAPAYCAQCHADPVMPTGPAGTGEVLTLPPGDRSPEPVQ